jgi:hypothetical protein
MEAIPEIMTIEGGEIRPMVAKSYALKEIVRTQKEFLDKVFVGKLVLIPPYG